MHRSRKEALAYARCKLSPAVGRMMHRGGKERLLDVSCLQPLAEGCAKVGRKRLLTHVTRHLTHVTRRLVACDPCYAAFDPCYAALDPSRYMRTSTMNCCWQHQPLAVVAAAPAVHQPLAVVVALEEVHQVLAAVRSGASSSGPAVGGGSGTGGVTPGFGGGASHCEQWQSKQRNLSRAI